MLLDLFKLENLKISSFPDGSRSSADKEFVAMFNPASYSQTYENVWSNRQGNQSNGATLAYQRSAPGDLSLTLVLDGTGVNEMGIFAFTQKTVSERIQEFLDVAYHYNGTIHEPNYLVVEWGDLKYPCRLRSVDIKYTAFEPGGKPLRAELTVKFSADETVEKLAKLANKTSPDLTHSRVVRSGDTLPLLTKEIYGSSIRYLDVARFNGLDDFRNLKPGQQLLFPPLAALDGKASGRG